MTNQRKHGKHSAALPETQPASTRETVAKTGAMTIRELEEKFATKEELKHSENFLAEKMDHGFQLHSQELRSVETNLTQKIDANEARAAEFRSDMNEQFKSSDARAAEFRSDMNEQFKSSDARAAEFRSDMNEQFKSSDARAAEFRSDMNEQFKDSDARNIERIAASEANLIQKIDANEARAEERAKHLESTIEQQSEKNLYKTAFLVVVIGGSLSGLAYGVYQLVKFLTGG